MSRLRMVQGPSLVVDGVFMLQCLGLKEGGQLIDDFVDVALQDAFQFVERKPDPVVAHATLLIVVRPDSFAPVAGPDLVFTLEHEQFNSDMENLGITYFVWSPQDIEGILANIEVVGAITDSIDEAEALVESMEERIADVEERVADVEPVSVFFIIDATDPTLPWTAGPGSFIDALITVVGGENVAGGALVDWAQFSIEEVVSADPDVIIVQTMFGGIPTIAIEDLQAHAIWGELSAVKQGNVYLVDGDLVSRSGPRIVEGLEALAEAIHPEIFD